MRQPRAQQVLAQCVERRRVIQVGAAAVGAQHQVVVAVQAHFHPNTRPQHAEAQQEVDIGLAQRRLDAARTAQCHQRGRRHRLVGNGAAVQQPLQRGVCKHLAPHDAGLDQLQEAVDEHLRAAVQPPLKAAGLARQGAVQAVGAQALQDAVVLGAVAVPHDQRLGDGVAQRSDADLQRAAVGHQAAGMQADGVVGRAHLAVGRAEQAVAGRWVGHHDVEEARCHRRAVGHERHLPVHHAHLQQRHAFGGKAFHQFEHHVGVAADRQLPIAARALLGDGLGDHVHALQQHVARHEGVVGGDVALLGHRVLQVVAGLQEELAHVDVGWQAGAAQRLHIVQVGVVAEHPLHERLQEVALQVALADGLFQAERGDDGQPAAGVGGDAAVQRIDEGVGLADGQRDAQHDVAGHGRQHRIHGVGKVVDHAGRGHGGLRLCRGVRASLAQRRALRLDLGQAPPGQRKVRSRPSPSILAPASGPPRRRALCLNRSKPSCPP